MNTTQTKLSPAQAAQSERTLYVRNTTDKIISHSDPNGGRLTLGPKWSEESISLLPKNVATNGDFQKLVRTGLVEVYDDPAFEDELNERTARIEERGAKSVYDLSAEIEEAPGANDIVPTRSDRQGVGREFAKPKKEGTKEGEMPDIPSYDPTTGEQVESSSHVTITDVQKG